MTPEFQVQKAGLVGQNWTTICRGGEAKAREIFLRQLRLYSVGRFRLLDPSGVVVEDRKVTPRFGDNPSMSTETGDQEVGYQLIGMLPASSPHTEIS
jgi:hypothetical protein